MNLNLKNISLFSIARDIVYNIWVVVLAAFIAASGTYIYTHYFHKPMYSSSMTISINQKNALIYTSTSLKTATQTASVFETIFKSEVMKDKIEEVSEKPMTGTVSTTPVNSTNLIIIKATSDTPDGAFMTLRAVYDNYRSVTDFAFEDIVVYVLNYPTVPKGPSNSISFFSLAMKTVPLACLAVIVVIALLSVLRDTIKSEAAVREILVLDVLASVYHERKNKTLKTYLKKKNKKIMLNDPLLNKSYIDSFKKITMKLEYLKRAHEKTVFMIASTNENEGKTTIAVNTALSLSNNGHRVLLIDLDLRKPSIWRFFPDIDFSSENNSQISDIIKHKKISSSDIIYDKETGLYLLSGKKSVQHSSEYLTDASFRILLSKLRTKFDYIIIDTPPFALISDAELISMYTDGVLLVVRQDNSSIDAINETISSFNRSSTVLGCIFNDVKNIVGFITGNYNPESHGQFAKFD